MGENLQTFQHQLDLALSDLEKKGFKLQVVSRQLDGKTNNNVLVKDMSQTYMLRLNRPDAAELGIDRQSELTILQHVEGVFAPPLVVWDVALGYQMTCYVQSSKRQLNDQDIEPIVTILKTFHGLDIIVPQIDYLQRIDRLVPSSKQAEWLKLRRRFEAALAKISEQYGYHAGLCHHDLVKDNILWPAANPAPLIIDWEYAALGDVVFDLATLVEANNLNVDQQNKLLQSYFAESEYAPKLLVYRAVYVMLCAAWGWRQGLENNAEQRKIKDLLAQFE